MSAASGLENVGGPRRRATAWKRLQEPGTSHRMPCTGPAEALLYLMSLFRVTFAYPLRSGLLILLAAGHLSDVALP